MSRWKPGAIGVQLSQKEGALLLRLLKYGIENGVAGACIDLAEVKDPTKAEMRGPHRLLAYELLERLRNTLNPETVTLCAECGDDGIEYEGWVAVNGGSECGDCGGDYYCSGCGEHNIDTIDVKATSVDRTQARIAKREEKSA